ncbi:MAG: DUF3010 family protein [Saprospiraceae bacterium]
MRIIGVHIDKSKAIFYTLEKKPNGEIFHFPSDRNYLTLTNDTDNESVRAFQSSIHSFFDSIKPDRIAILIRQTKGRFRSAPLSFKIEGLIQCYKKVEVEFVQPMKVSGYFKKNEFPLQTEHDYQEPAAKLAYYLLSGSE